MNTVLISDSLLLKSAINSLLEKSTVVKDIRVVDGNYDISKGISKEEVVFVATKKIDINIIGRLQKLKKDLADLKVVIIDVNRSHEVFTNTVMTGLDGYIADVENESEFNYIINTITKGKKFYDSQFLGDLFLSYKENKNKNVGQGITIREQEVIDYISKGYNNKEIANELYITEYTVKKHVTNILNKLNLRNRKEIIIYVKDNYNNIDLDMAQ